MANGIANNKKEEKKPKRRPAEQDEKSLVCVGGLVQTEKELDVKGTPVRGCKEQIQRGEYVSIKISSKPLQVQRDDNETGR